MSAKLPAWIDYLGPDENESEDAEVVAMRERLAELDAEKKKQAAERKAEAARRRRAEKQAARKAQLPSEAEEKEADGEVVFTEDDVLDWWEAYDSGVHYFSIARRADVPAKTVRDQLEWLGVWVGPRRDARYEQLKEAGGSPAAIDALMRWERGELTDDEQYLWNLLERMAPAGLAPEGVAGRPLPYARSLPHVAASRQRGPYIMSARQRALPGWGKHYAAVRAELRSAGLLPSGSGVHSRRVGRYWI